MSVTSAGKRPRTAIHPLPAGQSGRGVRRGTGSDSGRPRLTLVPPVPLPGPPEPRARAGTGALPAGAVPRPRMPQDGPPSVPGREEGPRPARGPAQPGRDAPGVRRGADRRPVRLTRRGRCVLWVAAGLILAALLTPVLMMAATGAQAANHGVAASAVRAGMRPVKVRPGDSLWSIALRAEPEADPRVVSQEIIQFNALSGSVLVPGETLWVPRG
jgi:hypothetical protein